MPISWDLIVSEPITELNTFLIWNEILQAPVFHPFERFNDIWENQSYIYDTCFRMHLPASV